MEGGGRASDRDIEHYDMHVLVYCVKALFCEHSVTMLGKAKLAPPEQRQKRHDFNKSDPIFKHVLIRKRKLGAYLGPRVQDLVSDLPLPLSTVFGPLQDSFQRVNADL